MRNLSVICAIVISMLAVMGCGTDSDQQSTSTVADSQEASYHTSYDRGEYRHYRRMYPARYSFVDSRGYGYYAFVHFIIKDTAHMEALKKKAEAALVKARAEAARVAAHNAAIFGEIKALEAEIDKLNAELNSVKATQSLIAAHARTLDKIALGQANKSVLRSVSFFLQIAGKSTRSLTGTNVRAINANQFTAQTEYRVIDGVIVRENKPVAFPGGTLSSYLSFLGKNSQNPKVGTEGHTVLLDLFEELKMTGAKRLEGIQNSKEATRKKTRKIFNKIEKLIAKYE